MKAAGFLYVRMLCAFEHVYDWLSPYLDAEDSKIQYNSVFYPNVDRAEELALGEYVRKLLKELDHYQLRLPRIPTLIDKEIQHKLAIRMPKVP